VIVLKKVGFSGSVGSVELRRCAIQGKEVRCRGLCKGAYVDWHGQTEDILCSVYEKAIDKRLNC
jgi:hypothetical protein